MERITIDDVAARAGVSPTTVSHVFSGHRPVSAETQKLVRSIAEELGYRANAVAQSLRTRRTSTVMIVLPDITNPFYPVFARGAQDALRQAEYQTLLCNTDSREDEELVFIEEALSRRLDGLIFMGYWVAPESLATLPDSGIAVVNLGDSSGRVDAVSSGDRAMAADVTRYLIERYGPDVAFIDGTSAAPVSRSRMAGFRDGRAELSSPAGSTREVSEDFTKSGGRRGMATLLDAVPPPRSVFCANDLIALGALEEAHERGLRVPQDVAIAGWDDIDLAALVSPSLTTVRSHPQRLGEASGQLLLSRMNGEYDGRGRSTVVPAELRHSRIGMSSPASSHESRAFVTRARRSR